MAGQDDSPASALTFRWFVTLWVIAFSFHYLDRQQIYAVPFVLGLVALPCLVAPGSAAAFALFLAASSVAIAIELPAAANHLMLALVVTAVFATSGLVVWMRRRDAAATTFAAEWLAAASPAAVQTLLVVYFFAVLHKLNSSFFDPLVSCARDLNATGFAMLGLSGVMSPALVRALAYGTIGCEAGVLVMLMRPSLRRWGVLLGVGFHLLLGCVGFADFAMFAFALYILVVRDQLATMRHAERWRVAGLLGWVTQCALVLVPPRVGVLASSGLPWQALNAVSWALVVVAFMGPVLVTLFSTDATAAVESAAPSAAQLRQPAPAWLLLFPLVALLNGMTPYLGLKTVANFSMFSNLRTEEQRTNHVVPALLALQVTSFEQDVVDVLEVGLPDPLRLSRWAEWQGGRSELLRQSSWLAGTDAGRVRVPWIELRRTVVNWKGAGVRGLEVRYERGGRPFAVADATTDPELAAPLPWWGRWLVAFRDIEPGSGPVSCRW